MTALPGAPTFPPAGVERRFYALAVDGLIGGLVVGGAVLATYLLTGGGRPGTTLTAAALVALLAHAGFAVLLGLRGVTPGKAALGLRAVHLGTGTPLGVGPALLRGAVLAVAALPTFGLGLAMLAWTALADRSRQRRGWHDHLAGSIVVDVRPVPVVAEEVADAPRHVVNLTAMRLVPASRSAVAVAVPAPTHPSAPAAEPLAPTPTRTPSHRSPLGTPPQTPLEVPARWRVTFDSGESLLVDGVVLVGRRPELRHDEQVRRVVALSSADMSLSKSHAQLQLAPDGGLVVTDRGSTNGSILLRGGVSRALTAGRPATLLDGDQVQLGDRRMSVVREP